MHDKSILKLSIQLLFVKHKVNQFYKNQNPLSICHSTIMQLKITYQTRDEQTLISVALWSSRPKKKILMKLSKSKVFTTTVWYLTYGLIIFVYLRFPGLPWVISWLLPKWSGLYKVKVVIKPANFLSLWRQAHWHFRSAQIVDVIYVYMLLTNFGHICDVFATCSFRRYASPMKNVDLWTFLRT